MEDFRRAFLSPEHTLSDALQNMTETGFRAALVVQPDGTLLGLVTDGDVRKSLLAGVGLGEPVSCVMNPQPLLAHQSANRETYRDLMLERGNECIPVLNERHQVVELVFLREFIQKEDLQSTMVIMAGGAGKRLGALTRNTPKPLLPVADKPLLGHLLERAGDQGFKNVWISTHYQSEKIERFLEEGTPAGVKANIIKEENPLGTAGCLKALLQQTDDKPIFIMNGDILTTLDFQTMLDWHHAHQNRLTVACRQHAQQIQYGVLETDGQRLRGIQEKPVSYYNINAGIYLVDRQALHYIPDEVYFDMTDLIEALLRDNQPVGTFPVSEAWIDIGKPEDYERVNREFHRFAPNGAVAGVS